MRRYFFLIVLLVTLVVVLSSQYLNDPLPNQSTEENPSSTPIDTLFLERSKQQYTEAYKSLVADYDKSLQYENVHLEKTGTVVANTLNIRSHPNSNWGSTILTTITQGDQLDILGEYSAWYQVSYQGTIGWASKEFIAPVVTTLTNDTSMLQIGITNNNTIEFIADMPFEPILTNHGNGKYTIHFNTILFANSTFDFNHYDIPLFRTFSNQLEIYTNGWIYGSLTKHSDAIYSMTFSPVVYDVSLDEQGDRTQLIFNTSGRPNYNFETNDNHLIINFAEDIAFNVDFELLLNQLVNSKFIRSIEYNDQHLIIETSEPVTWKVFANSHTLTIDISNRGIEGKRIVIDPGHGGSEIGTYGRHSKVTEKDFNLEVSHLLKAALEDQGALVYMTRTDDSIVYQGDNYETYLDLLARVAITKEHEADFFISIHADNFPADLSVNGTAAFYYSEHPHSFQSEMLAKRISLQVSESIGTKWLGAHDRSFVVVRHNPFPSVLMELGFLSNKNDEAKLIDLKYQQKMVISITQAIADYYK